MVSTSMPPSASGHGWTQSVHSPVQSRSMGFLSLISKLVPHSEIQMLGVPLGSDSFVSEFVEKKLLGRLLSTVNRLVEFEDTQAATYLLRVSYSIVRAVHFMRTTPLRQKQAVSFDAMMRSAIERILATSPSHRLVSLPNWGDLVCARLLSTPTWLFTRVGMNLRSQLASLGPLV